MKYFLKTYYRIVLESLLILSLLAPISKTQIMGDFHGMNPTHSSNRRLLFYSDRSYLETSKSWYSTYSIETRYQINGTQLGAQLPINQAQHFILMPEPAIFELNEPEIDFEDSTRFKARADEYVINTPFSIFGSANYRGWYFYGSLTLLSQKTWSETPNWTTGNNLIFINWESEQKQNYSALADILAGYRFSKLTLKAGFANLKLAGYKDSRFKYKLNPKILPLMAITYQTQHWRLNSLWDTRSFTFKFSHYFKYLRSVDLRHFKTSLVYRNGTGAYRFQTLKIGFEFPLNNHLSAQIGYMNTRTPTILRNKSTFKDWQSTLFFDTHDFRIGSRLPQQSAFLQLSFNLNSEEKVWPIEVNRVQLLHTDFFTYKSDFYIQEPVGFIDICNKSSRRINISLNLRITTGSTAFKTSVTPIESGASERLELYLHIDKKDHGRFISREHLEITAIINNQAKMIASEPVNVWGKNVWNGKIKELEWFVSNNPEKIKKYAEELLDDVLMQYSNNRAKQNVRKFLILKDFLTRLGNGLSYASDAITGSEMDYVQYPIETHKRKKGDCEDLTVYTIALLRAVGIQTAVVAIRPDRNVPITSLNCQNPQKQGHVFLLVDTDIDAREINQINLNELEAISRVNSSARRTLWLPIEPTQLQFGFNKAFQQGIELYYQEIIDKKGMENETVKVYDF